MSEGIREYQRFVTRLASQMARGAFDADDLAQDVLERWLRAAPALPPTINPRAWLTVALRNLLIDRTRRRRARTEVPHDPESLPAVEPERAPWWLELETDDVTAVLAQLPAAQRRSYERFALRGQSYEQISCELAIPKSTVGVHVHRARARLRELLLARSAAAARS
jgi:RNA polymerase sigma-70 factor, ECF subfamily